MLKRIISMILVLVMAVGILPGTDLMLFADAADLASGYCGGEGDGTNLTWTLTEDGTLTISGQGEMEKYTSNRSPWCNNTDIKSITIGDGVTSIGDSAFASCGTTTVTIPDSVTSIGNNAFHFCHALTAVEIGESVTSIGDGAFYDCYNLKEVTIPDGVKSIGRGAFFDCASLKTVTIPDSVTSVGIGAFGYCSNLTSVMIGSGVTCIDIEGFAACSNLATVTIHNSVKNINATAFKNCYALSNVYYIGTEDQWQAITVDTGNTSLLNATIHFVESCPHTNRTETLSSGGDKTHTYTWTCDACGEILDIVIMDCITDADGDNLCDVCGGSMVTVLASGYCGGEGDGTNLTWTLTEDGTLTISGQGEMKKYTSSGAPWYSYNADIKSITIGDGVTNIGDYAFNNCNQVSSVEIGDSVTNIGDRAFYCCSDLISVTIPDSVMSINYDAFYGCHDLTSVTIGNGVTSIGTQAFRSCSKLSSITIPGSVTTVGSYAFSGCEALTEVNYTGTEEQWSAVKIKEGNAYLLIAKNGVISGSCGENLTWTLTKDGALTISGQGEMKQYASNSYAPWHFYCGRLSTLTIGDGVTSIGDYAFQHCYGLTSIEISGDVTSIGKDAFSSCGSLEFLTIGDSVRSIGDGAFSQCNSLKYATIGDGVTSLGNETFYNCYNLISVTIGDSVTSIGDSVFEYCSNLNSVTLPDSVTSIGNYAFYHCYRMSSVTMGDGVTSVGDYAFYGCRALGGVIYSGTEEQWQAITVGTGNDPLRNAYVQCLGSCTHPAATEFIKSNGDKTHTSTMLCGACGKIVDTLILACVDADGDGLCDTCDGSMVTVLASGYCGGEGDGTNLTWTLTEDGTLTISGTGAMADYAPYAAPWYAYWKQMKTLVVRDGVTTIGVCAFCGCGYLTGKLELPDSVEVIGDYAFAHCSFTDYGDHGPSDEPPAEEDPCVHENISETVRYIGSYQHSLLICEDCDQILARAACDVDQNLGGTCSVCGHIYSAVCTHSVTDSVCIPYGTNTHKTLVCADCGKVLQTQSCTDANSDDLCDLCGGKMVCTHETKTEAYVCGGNERHSTHMCDKCGKLLGSEACTSDPAEPGVCLLCGGEMKIPETTPDAPIVLPDEQTVIQAHSYENCTTYTGELVLPNGCVAIGTRAFYNCSGFTGDLTIPGKVQTIGAEAFYNCTGLGENLYVSASVTAVRAGAFGKTGFAAAYFLGNAPSAVEASAENPSFPTDITLYYTPGATGWIDSADYDAEAGTWKGYKLAVWKTAENCTHENVELTYIYVGQNHHKGKTTCLDCGWESCRIGGCFDADLDGRCDLCGAEYLCRHEKLETTYTSNGNETHEVCSVCRQCGFEETKTLSCTDKNNDRLCDRCGAALACRHLRVTRTYKYSGNSTHAMTVTCTDCGEVLHKDVKNDCVDNDYDYRCDLCGQMMQEHVLYSGPCGAEGNEDNLWWYLLSNNTLVIRGTGPMKDYEDEGKQKAAPWYQHKKLIYYLVLEEGITHIGSYAFKGCNKLRGELHIPESVQTIGERAFQNNKFSKTLTIPQGVQIGAYAFQGCSGFDEDLIVGAKGRSTFSLQRTAQPAQATTIGEGAFADCTGFTGMLILEEGVVSIGADAFTGTKFAGEVSIPSTVTTIHDGAFRGCDAIRTILFRGNAPAMGADAFDQGVSITYTAGTEGWTDTDDYNETENTWNGIPLNVHDETACLHTVLSRVYTAGEDETHLNTASCALCGTRLSILKQPCEDRDGDLACDSCDAHVASAAEKLEISGSNMTLGNELSLNFMVDIQDIDVAKAYTALLTHSGKTVELPMCRYNEAYYSAELGVAAKEMADEVRMTLVDENGDIINKAYTRTIREYAHVALNSSTMSDTVKTMMVDMLNYGAAAQKHFGYRTEDLANNQLTEEQKAMATPDVACVNRQVKGENFYGSNLSLEDSILLNLFFEGLRDKDLSTMYATVSFAGYDGVAHEINVPGTEFVRYTNDIYKVVVDDIVLADARQLVTVTVYNADGTEHGSGADSVESYNARAASIDTHGLYASIMKFATSAYNYITNR